MKIRFKIMGMVAILLLLMVISSGFGIVKIKNIGNELKGIAEEDIPLTEALTGVTINQLEQAVHFSRSLQMAEWMKHLKFHHPDPEDTEHGVLADVVALLEHEISEFDRHSGKAAEQILNAKKITGYAAENAPSDDVRIAFEKALTHLEDILSKHQVYNQHAHQVFALLRESESFEINELAEKIEKEEETLDIELEAFLKQIENFTHEAALSAEHDEQAAFTGMTGITFGALIVGLILSFLVSQGISRPVKAAVAGLKDIAQGEGDLTMRLQVKSRDEIGELAGWFNTFIEKLQGIIKDIAGGVDTISSSSTELSAISEQMNQGITTVSDSYNTVSTAAEEMSTNMITVAAAMEQSATNTNMVATAAEQMSSTIAEIAQNSEKARGISDEASHKASSTSSNMNKLGEAASTIGQVIETITDISEQVNLLALNATIEAARAGEAGKGFAVVANEIKDLATQTAEATGDIKEKIAGIQGITETTVGQISEITQVIAEVNYVVSTIATAVEEQTATTRDIALNVAQASQGIQEVNENVNQSSAVSTDISKDISEVSVSMNEMSISSNQVSLSAQELSKLSESLEQLVGQFKV